MHRVKCVAGTSRFLPWHLALISSNSIPTLMLSSSSSSGLSTLLARPMATASSAEKVSPVGIIVRQGRWIMALASLTRAPASVCRLGLTRQHNLHGAGLADSTCQALGAAGTGNGANLDLRLTKDGLLRGVHDVTHHGQLAASAELGGSVGRAVAVGEGQQSKEKCGSLGR